MKKEKIYDSIKEKLIDDEVYSKVKDYSKERHRVITYFEVGKILSEAGKHYGEDIIGNFSKKLMIDVGKKYNARYLYDIRKFYIIFSAEKVPPVGALSWSHYRILITIKDENERNYYMNKCITNHLTKRELEDIKKNKEYERLPNSTKIKLIENKESNIVV